MLNTLHGTDQTRNVAVPAYLHYKKQSVFKTVLPAGLRVTGKGFQPFALMTFLLALQLFLSHKLQTPSLILKYSASVMPFFTPH